MSAYNKVLVRTNIQESVFEELGIKTSETIYPSYLVDFYEHATLGPQFKANTTKGAPALVACENEAGMSGDYSLPLGTLVTTQLTGRLRAKYLRVGDMVLVTIVDSQAIAKGDLLTASATAGKVGLLMSDATSLAPVNLASQPSAASAQEVVSAQLVLRAEEALTSGASNRQILVRVLRV